MTETGIPSAVIAAIITGAVSLLALAINMIVTGMRNRNIRRREEFSKAFAACIAYEEFPYIVRRRKISNPEEERIRISTELSKIQRELAYHSAWLSLESKKVSKAYDLLICKLREIAGEKVREAWLSQPINSDTGMNMPDLGLSALKPFKEKYLQAVASHLSLSLKSVFFANNSRTKVK